MKGDNANITWGRTMSGFNSWRVSTRMQLLIGLTLAGLLILCIIALMQFRDGMLEDRKEKTKNLVEVSMGVLEYHQKLAQSGKLSDDEAKQAAKESLRNVRFGANDYSSSSTLITFTSCCRRASSSRGRTRVT